MKNYLSLIALCSLMIMIPSCRNGETATTTTSTTEVQSEPVEVVVIEEEEVTEPSKSTQTKPTDKEDLSADTLAEVMNNR